MDNYDLNILRVLQANARITIRELSKQIHLSQPACSERVKKLEASGIIKGYNTQINWEKLGYPIAAIVRITPLPGKLNQVEKIIKTIDDSLFEILQVATTSTSVIKYTVVENRFIGS